PCAPRGCAMPGAVGRHIMCQKPADTDIQQYPVEFRADENAEDALHARSGSKCETPEIHERKVQFNLACRLEQSGLRGDERNEMLTRRVEGTPCRSTKRSCPMTSTF